MVASGMNGGEAVPKAARDALARLAGGDWLSELSAVLSELGSSVDVDRAYVFQNVRGPDGRLWMDMRGEWDAPGVRQIFDEPHNHLHPYHPDLDRDPRFGGSHQGYGVRTAGCGAARALD